ncbi:MAG: hypothetical protein GX193_06885 [Clostridiales bacterium]|nr:hypothetical protein [Clostridiales bacterium]
MKKIIALVIVFLMCAALFAGCNNEEKITPSDTGVKPTVSNDSPSNVDSKPDDDESGGLPLVDTPVTVTAWWPCAFTLSVIPSMEENLVFKEMARLTNVYVSFTTPSSASMTEQFNLLITSGEFYDFDMISYFPLLYNKGLDNAIDELMVVPLEDYLEIMPNIKALRDNNEAIRKGTTTDKGHFGGIPLVKVDKNGNAQGAWVGGVIRQDWLDELNLKVPRTYDQAEQVFKTFQDNGLAEHPLWIRNDGFTMGNIVNGGFNVINGFYQVNGRAKYGPMEPDFRRYLEKLNDWYNKGYIAPDFYAQQDYFGPIDKVANNEYAVFDCIYTWNKTYKLAAADPDFKLTAMRILVENENDPVHVRMTTDPASQYLCFPYGSKNVELLCRYWDYLFSEEGILLSNYGVEGETFEYDENGEPVWSGPLKSDAPEFNLSDTQGAYFLYNSPGYILFDRELSVVEPEAAGFVDIWNEDGCDYFFPGTATMTSEENTEYANIMGDVQTFVSENLVKFIIGEKSFDEYDNFINEMKKLRVERAIELRQAALDRYNSR